MIPEEYMDVKAIAEMIENYIRPATFPVGLKMLKTGEALPPQLDFVQSSRVAEGLGEQVQKRVLGFCSVVIGRGHE